MHEHPPWTRTMWSGAYALRVKPCHASRRSTSGSSRAKSRWLGQAARAASRSAPDQSRASGRALVALAGLGAEAVVFVVGQEPGEVAELGHGAGRGGAPAVAIGAEHRTVGERRVAKLAQVGGLHRLRTGGPRRC